MVAGHAGRGRRRQQDATMAGSNNSGRWAQWAHDGLARFFLFFSFFNRRGQAVCVGKLLIYRDLEGEVDGLAHLRKLFFPASNKKIV
jgi:hypothetical protein